jgi:hypothetical protein
MLNKHSFFALAASALAAAFVFTICCPCVWSAEQGGESYDLKSRRKPGDLDHVTLSFDATGNVIYRAGPDFAKAEDSANGDKLNSPAKSGSASQADAGGKLPMSVECRRDYDEKTLEISSGTANVWRSVRAYHDAHAIVRKGESEQKPTLRGERSLIAVEVSGPKVTAFSPQGPLAIDELDLVTATGESLAIDGLLPQQPVKLNEKWKVTSDALTAMLDLDEVSEQTVEMSLTEVTPAIFRTELEGHVVGKLYGAANQLDLKAKCRIDRRTGRIDWFAMRVSQSRENGAVEPGLEVKLLIQMKISPLEKCDLLADNKLNELTLKPTDALCRVQYTPTEGQWRVMHDRQWYLVEHFRDLDIFHRLEHGQDIALCKVSRLQQTAPAALPTLSRFQESVQKALGTNFASLVEASQGVTGAGYRYYRVVAAGKDGEAPVQWFYYHVADDAGRQAAFAFRVEAKNLDAFNNADNSFLQTLRFIAKDDSRRATQTGQRTTAAPK